MMARLLPAAVVRGVLNTVLVEMWCQNLTNKLLVDFIDYEISLAANAAHREAATSDFKCEPRVRLSHVGEVAAYPEFANHVARMLGSHFKGPVKCVIYTRHSNARRLDADRIVINFSLDDSSRENFIRQGRAHLHMDAVQVDDGVDRIKRPRLPGLDLFADGVGD